MTVCQSPFLHSQMLKKQNICRRGQFTQKTFLLKIVFCVNLHRKREIAIE